MLEQAGLSIMPDMKAPKSSRRLLAALTPTKLFHHFDPAPPVPSLPMRPPSSETFGETSTLLSFSGGRGHKPSSSQSSNSIALGSGVQIVKTPMEATWDCRPSSPGGSYSQPLRSKASSKSLTSVAHHQRQWSQSSSEGPKSPLPNDRRQTLKAKLSLHSLSTKTPTLPPLKHLRSQLSLGGWYPPGIEPFDLNRISATNDTSPDVQRQKSQILSEKQLRDAHRSTVRPPPRRPRPSTPFEATLISKTTRPAPTAKCEVLVTLQFGYSSAVPPKNAHVTLPWRMLRNAEGHLADFVADYVEAGAWRGSGVSDGRPEMTDASSASESDLESEFDLDTLPREEYMKSIYLSPSQNTFELPPPLPITQQIPDYSFPPLPPLPGLPLSHTKAASVIRPKVVTLAGEKRRVVKNQYTQQDPYPSPSSTLLSRTTPINIRCKRPELKVEAKLEDGGGTITEVTVLLMRDASLYHLLVARLVVGRFDGSEEQREGLEAECRWLGMDGLADELGPKRERSFVRRGGDGYI